MMISVIGKIEGIVRMGEDAGHQHPLPFQQYFKKANFPVASAYCLYISNSSRRYDQRQNMKVNKRRKHCENGQRCWLPASSPLSTMFQLEGLYS